ncbi:hypothetical protein SprV_0802559600 [Sparganum proliferum]
MLSASVLTFLFALVSAGEPTDSKPFSFNFSSTSETINVKWEDPSCGPAYLYEVSITGQNLDQTEILYSNVYEHTFTEGILPFTTYSVKVSAINLVGERESEEKNVTTWPGKDKIVGQTSTVEDNISLKSLNNGHYFVELYAITKANGASSGGGKGPTNRVGPIAVPSVRTNVTLKYAQMALGTIRLQWDFSQIRTSCGIYSNTIYYNDGDKTDKEVSIPASNQYILKNLAPGVHYTFVVSADCVGSIAAFTKDVQATPDQYPPSAPQNLHAKVTSNSLDVSWSPPASPNGILGAYSVSIDNGTVVSNTTGGLTASFSNLKSSTTYIVTVKAQTAAGFGPAASITVQTDADAPSLPSNIRAIQISSDKVHITWDPPMSSRAGAGKEEMIVKSFKGGVLLETAKKSISEGVHVVNEIQPNTVMSFTVQVVSPGPLGGYSEIKQLPDLITWPARGGIPSDFSASATETTILLWWEKPQGRPTGIVKHYEVKVKDKTGNENDTVVRADEHTFKVQSLTPLTMYTVEIRTMNKPAEGTENGGGLGDPAVLDVETWPGGSFEPINGKVEVLPPSAIKVSWSPPQGLIGSVEEYHVLLKKGDALARSEAVPGTTMSLTLTELKTGVKYKVYIQAKIAPNSQGKGGRFGPEVFITETALTEQGGGNNAQLTGGLSGGAIAGIVIGVILAFVLLLLLLLVLMRRRKQNVMIDDFQWSEGTGASFFNDDIEMSQIGSDLGSML